MGPFHKPIHIVERSRGLVVAQTLGAFASTAVGVLAVRLGKNRWRTTRIPTTTADLISLRADLSARLEKLDAEDTA